MSVSQVQCIFEVFFCSHFFKIKGHLNDEIVENEGKKRRNLVSGLIPYKLFYIIDTYVSWELKYIFKGLLPLDTCKKCLFLGCFFFRLR